jgi:hypothetical protein
MRITTSRIVRRNTADSTTSRVADDSMTTTMSPRYSAPFGRLNFSNVTHPSSGADPIEVP